MPNQAGHLRGIACHAGIVAEGPGTGLEQIAARRAGSHGFAEGLGLALVDLLGNALHPILEGLKGITGGHAAQGAVARLHQIAEPQLAQPSLHQVAAQGQEIADTAHRRANTADTAFQHLENEVAGLNRAALLGRFRLLRPTLLGLIAYGRR